MSKIQALHEHIISIIEDGVSAFNQAFPDRPKAITDEKLPAFAVYFDGHDNDASTNRSNKRTYRFAVEIIYDKEDSGTTAEVTADLVSQTIDVLEDTDNSTMGGNAHYTLPTKCDRIEDYVIAGKHYRAYRIILQIISNESV